MHSCPPETDINSFIHIHTDGTATETCRQGEPGVETTDLLPSELQSPSWSTYRQRGVFIQLVFGSNAKTSVVAAGGPGQSDRRLQLVIHLLVDGAAKLGPIVTERETKLIQKHSGSTF